MSVRYELEQFSDNGFAGPFKLYEPEETKEILKIIRCKNSNSSNAIFNNPVNYDRHFDIEELGKHIAMPQIISRLQKILGSDILCWRTEFFPKFPGSAGTEWHQVANYQYANGIPMLEPTEPDNEFIDITVWTTFTLATIENGCMKFLPGSHKKKYYDESKPVDYKKNVDYKPVESDTGFFGYQFSEFKIDPLWEPDESKAVSLEMNPGEFVIFTAKCVHASHPNITERSTRFAISSRYVQAQVRVYPDQKNFFAHGSSFDLEKYGCVLVSGEDNFHHNKIRELDNYDNKFQKL